MWTLKVDLAEFVCVCVGNRPTGPTSLDYGPESGVELCEIFNFLLFL